MENIQRLPRFLVRVVKCSNNDALYEVCLDDKDFCDWAVVPFDDCANRIKEPITVVVNGQTFTNVQTYEREHGMHSNYYSTYIECILDDTMNDIIAVI